MLESDDISAFCVTRSDRLRPNTTFNRIYGTECDKSSVDDFDQDPGIVRVRVGLSYDPLRLSPCSKDLYERLQTQYCVRNAIPPPPNKQTNQNNNNVNKQTPN